MEPLECIYLVYTVGTQIKTHILAGSMGYDASVTIGMMLCPLAHMYIRTSEDPDGKTTKDF
jgi:hypothetical protein